MIEINLCVHDVGCNLRCTLRYTPTDGVHDCLPKTPGAAFINFVMGQYVHEGVGELDRDKLAPQLTLKYRSVVDAVAELGNVTAINDAFFGCTANIVFWPLSSLE